MKQIERIGDATLILGDCRDILPKISRVDVVITDPVWPNSPLLKKGDDDPKYVWERTWLTMPKIKRAVTVLRQDSDPRFLDILPLQFAQVMQLPCKERIDLVAYCHSNYCPYAATPMPRRVYGWNDACGHPAAKALPHFLHLVKWWSDKSDTILDPFMGSGTTGEAAIRLGRKFIGIEQNKTYFEMACSRLQRSGVARKRTVNSPLP